MGNHGKIIFKKINHKVFNFFDYHMLYKYENFTYMLLILIIISEF